MSLIKKVFIIDDDPIYKLIIRKLFERQSVGLQLDFFDNGQEGIQGLKEVLQKGIAAPPDIILLDVEMPIMNGWDFMDAFIRLPVNQRGNVSIYIVTSSISQEDKEKAMQYPEIKAYLTKPLNAEKLQEITRV